MLIKMRSIQVVMILTLCLQTCKGIAGDSNFNHGFDQGIQTATALQHQSLSALQTFQPEKVIKNYTSDPKESNYQSSPDTLKSDAVANRETDAVGQHIMKGIDDRKSQFNYVIDPNSPAIQNILKKSDSVYDVITGEFGDCTKQTDCTTNYETKVCEESPKSNYQYCQKILNIDVIPHQEVKHFTLNAYLSVADHNYAGVSINTVSGKVNFLGPHEAKFQLVGRLPSGLDCKTLQGKILSASGSAKLDNINFPVCGNGLTLDFHISDGHNKNLQIDITSTTIKYETKDRWDDQCLGIAKNSSCSFQEEHCVASASTKVIQGISVTRDCWEKQDSYFCGGTTDIQTCQPYRDQACEQVNSICKNKNDSGCTLYEETYRCPTKQCTDVGMICNGQTYCLNGDCVKQQKQADPDFQRSVTTLTAVNETAKSYDMNQSSAFPIFGGVVKTCNKDFLDFANCCSDSGWGIDLHLGQCDQEAKDLGDAKENGLTTYVDSDEDCTLGLCSHKKRYCVFPSKLARIIQENGRRDQLHKSFGDFKNPDCKGITPEEFAKLDLSKINFNEVFSDITKKVQLEDKNKLNERVNEKLQEWSKEKTSHA